MADAVENELHNTTEMIWGVSSYAGVKGERKLMEQLLNTMAHLTNNTARFNALNKHVVKHGVGHLVGLKYGSFNMWLKGEWINDNQIHPENKRAMLSFSNKDT